MSLEFCSTLIQKYCQLTDIQVIFLHINHCCVIVCFQIEELEYPAIPALLIDIDAHVSQVSSNLDALDKALLRLPTENLNKLL